MNERLGFSAEQASRLTGLSLRQLRYWDATAFFTHPSCVMRLMRALVTLYSFRDIVGLRAIAEMRQRHRIPLQQLRRVGPHLREHYDEPWSELVFYLVGKDVFFRHAHREATERADRTRQQLMPIELVKVEGDVRRDLAKMRRRSSDQIGKVTRRRHIAQNNPVLEGTRVPTTAIWEYHHAARSNAEIRRACPQLQPGDIEAALEYESKRVRRVRAG